jgi:hypothetical protein
MEEREMAAAILGELIPELEYAAPVLLDRLESGVPLVDRKSPSDIGFDTGMIDVQLLDLFRVLAPYVTAALSYGILGTVQSWLLHDRGKKSQDELLAALRSLRIENAELRQVLDSIAGALSHAGNVPVSQFEIDEAIAAAVARLAQEGR